MGKMTTIRSLVRPTVTWVVVGAFVAAAFWSDRATEALRDIALVVIAFYFGSRTSNSH